MKILLGFLALATLISASFLFSFLGNSNGGAANISGAIDIKTQLDDDDHDGLTNRDEAYWGTDPSNSDTDGDTFLDGEEIVSGHDPRKKGPNDYLDPGKNLTQRTVDLTLGGMVAGDLKPDSPNYEASVKMLAAAMTEQFKQNTTIVLEQLRTVEDSPETKQAYLQAMSGVFLQIMLPATKDIQAFLESLSDVSISNPSAITQDAKRYASFSATTRRLSVSMGDRAARLAAIPVPKSFLSQNQAALQIIRLMQKYLEIAGNIKTDPFQASIALGSLIRLQYDTIPLFMYDFGTALSIKFTS